MATGELGFITLYAPEIDRASGQFDANLSFEGTLGTAGRQRRRQALRR